MATNVQNPVATRALVDAYDIKGRFRLQLDEVLAPVVIVGDVRPTAIAGATYQRSLTVEAAGGEFPILTVAGLEDGSTTILHRLRVWCDHPTESFMFVLANPTAVATAGFAAMQGVNRLDPQRPSTTVGAAGAVAVPPTGTRVMNISLLERLDTIVDLEGWELPGFDGQSLSRGRLHFLIEDADATVVFDLIWSVRRPGE